ncbi:MAG TPA: HD domain-containing protein, partial [bacterium]|nr:HD domain-containing protein [bacterium]
VLKGFELAKEISVSEGTPLFYIDNAEETAQSINSLKQTKVLADCMGMTGGPEGNLGHGARHSLRVAVDAGAIVIIESSRMCLTPERAVAILRLVQTAALLHDIRRSAPHHAEAGAEAAKSILKELGLPEDESEIICLSIASHEAFRPYEEPLDPEAALVCDALYDADKFRWGPDNFTETLWLMLEAAGIPVEAAVKSYPEKITGIEAIKKTFRTVTGRKYGPDFIERGVRIGEKVMEGMKKSMGME